MSASWRTGPIPSLWPGRRPRFDVPLCTRVLGQTVPIFPWGDLSARCTNGNGVLDTEDLNADLTLNAKGTAENVFRYVVTLGGPKYFVRDGVSAPDQRNGLFLRLEALPDSAAGAGRRHRRSQHAADSAPARARRRRRCGTPAVSP